MDPTKLVPAAPTTTDPITWIAILLVAVLVAILVWQLRASADDRTHFLGALEAQRAHDSASVAETHKRIDGLSVEVRELSKEVAARAA